MLLPLLVLACSKPTPPPLASLPRGVSPRPPPDVECPDGPPTCLPGTILNLTPWKVTLPIDEDGDGKADEVKQPELATYEHPDWLHGLADCSGVRFAANAGGATTSGSDNPRSELRERTADGLDNASWDSADGSGHRLVVSLAVTELTPVKPHIVVGQIHDSDDDLFAWRLEGERLFLSIDGAADEDEPTLVDPYVLGTPIELKFEVRDGEVHTFVDGCWKHVEPRVFSGGYFKAGAYVQSHPGRGEDPAAVGAVEIYSVEVSHD